MRLESPGEIRVFRFAKGTGQRVSERPAHAVHHHQKPASRCADAFMCTAVAAAHARPHLSTSVAAAMPVLAMPGVCRGMRLSLLVSRSISAAKAWLIGMGSRYMH